MKNISYHDAVKLLLDLEDETEYRDYAFDEEKRILMGGAVGKEMILQDLFEHRYELQIPDDEFFNVNNICHGITYIRTYNDNRKGRMFIPVDFNKLKNHLETLK